MTESGEHKSNDNSRRHNIKQFEKKNLKPSISFSPKVRGSYTVTSRGFRIRSVAVVWSPSSRVGGCPGASSQHDQIVLGNRLEVRLSEPRGGDDLLLLRWRRRRGWFSENYWSDSASLLQLRVCRQVGLYTHTTTHIEKRQLCTY